ncbi:guanine deaminase [Reinekea sp. G2M2-21]|uniref:guanine deaminase n=1 Tax=Reinekea sp. G2M2-21 TaxID=2788942 RepID=UPI0018A8DBD4|nr:guanine deaminase [Reinekea sp. G2M2-21]
MSKKIIIGDLLDFLDDPAHAGESAVRYVEQGALLIENGKITQRGSKEEALALAAKSPDIDLVQYDNKLIIPGMIDTHVHYPQTEMIAAYGEQLLTWLTEHAFPTEKQFADKAHGSMVADVFLSELLKNGTTTALVFGTVHPQSVDAFFEVAQQKGLRMICGKVMMDRNCPDDLQDTAASGYADSKALIEKWHGVDRLSYAVTPRFAPTSTPEQLQACKKLLDEYEDVYMHTHVSENVDECAWVKELFPESKDYVGVYEDAGLLRKRSVLAHGIHFNERELCCVADNDTAIAHCPTSNLFIGSGLFNIQQMREHNIKVGMGTDVGGGSSFSLLKTYNEAYKVQQLQNNKLSAFEGLYLNTLGGARALDLEGIIGQLEVGCEADIAVLDYAGTPFMDFRLQRCKGIHEKLFALMMLGDDRSVFATYANGEKVHQR